MECKKYKVSVLNTNIFIAAQHWQVLQYHLTNTLYISPFFFFYKKIKTGLNHRVKVLVS